MSKELRRKRKVSEDLRTHEELDFELQEARETNKLCLALLLSVAEEAPELAATVEATLRDAGIPATISRPPSEHGDALSARSGSSQGSGRSRASQSSRTSGEGGGRGGDSRRKGGCAARDG
jgi:hypothetical protein